MLRFIRGAIADSVAFMMAATEIMMSRTHDQSLLEALLDSWDRNNTILLNLLRALPEGGLEARAMEGSPSISELFTHIHFVRLGFVFEDAPGVRPKPARRKSGRSNVTLVASRKC